MPRRGGKRIRMDDPPPLEYEDDIYRGAIGYAYYKPKIAADSYFR